MVQDHANRAHAKWSPSSAARYMQCAGAYSLEATMPDRPEGEAAAWGTACHEVAEALLRGQDPDRLKGGVVETKSHTIRIDEDVLDTAQVFADYIQPQMETKKVYIEERVKLGSGSVTLPIETYGTADAIIWDAGTGTLEVADLKTGMGVVEAPDNDQLLHYAFGAVSSLMYHPKTVVMTIIQPRVKHKDGSIRSWSIDYDALLAYARRVFEAQTEAIRPGPTFSPSETACKFCKAAAVCTARSKFSLSKVGSYFEDETLKVSLTDPKLLSTDQQMEILDNAKMLEDWINAVRAHVHREIDSGSKAYDGRYQLARKRGSAKWSSSDENVRAALRFAYGLSDDEMYAPRKLKSVPQMEKLLKESDRSEFQSLWSMESSGTNLVSCKKTSRAPEKPKVEKFFDDLT